MVNQNESKIEVLTHHHQGFVSRCYRRDLEARYPDQRKPGTIFRAFPFGFLDIPICFGLYFLTTTGDLDLWLKEKRPIYRLPVSGAMSIHAIPLDHMGPCRCSQAVLDAYKHVYSGQRDEMSRWYFEGEAHLRHVLLWSTY